MEMQTLLIGVTCCIMSAVIIYLISMFSMREKTFEEVMEEQRLRLEEEEKKARSEKKAERGDRKKYKKFKEKNKEKAQQLKGVEIDGTFPQVNTIKKEVRVDAISELAATTGIIQVNTLKLEKKQVKEVNSMPLVANQSANVSASPKKEEKIPKSQRKQTGSPTKEVSSSQQNFSQNINYVPDTKPENSNRKSQKTKSPKVDTDTHKVVELHLYDQNTSKKVGAKGKENEKPKEDAAAKKENKNVTAKAPQKSSSLPPPQEILKKEKAKKTSEPAQKVEKKSSEATPAPQEIKKKEKVKKTTSETSQKSSSLPPSPPQEIVKKEKAKKISEISQSSSSLPPPQEILKKEKAKKTTSETSQSFSSPSQEILKKEKAKKTTSEISQSFSSPSQEILKKEKAKKTTSETSQSFSSLSPSQEILKKEKAKKTTSETAQKVEKKSSVAAPAPQEIKKKEKAKKTTSEKVDDQSNKKTIVETIFGKKVKDVATVSKEFDEKQLKKVNAEKEKLEHELAKMISKSSNIAKQNEEQQQKLRFQNEKLRVDMKTLEENLNQKVEQLVNQMKNNKAKYQKVIEENNILKKNTPKPIDDKLVEKKLELQQTLNIMEKELAKNSVRLEVADKQKLKLELKVKELQNEKVKNDSSTVKKFKEQTVSLKNLQNDKSRLNVENEKLNEALRQAETQCALFNVQLKDLYEEIKNKETDGNEKIKALEKELLSVKQENKVLKETNKHVNNPPLTIETPLERQDPAGAPNGELQKEKFTCTKVPLIEHERILGEKNSKIMQLTSELSKRVTETTARVGEKDNEIQALTSKLNNNIKEVEELKEEIKVWHAKNDDLRKKNWKAMEALNDAEVQATDSLTRDRTVIQSIFPSVTVDKSLEHTVWMKTFEQKAIEFLKSKADEPVSNLEEMSINVELFKQKLDDAMKESSQLAAQLKSEKDLQIKISDNLKESENNFIELQSTYEGKLTELTDELVKQKNKYLEIQKLYEALQSDSQLIEAENNQELKEQVNSFNSRLDEAAEEKNKLESKLKEYQNLLLTTDEKLQLLQKSVEEEEKKWKCALSEAENEIQVLKEKQTSLQYVETQVSEQQTLIEEDLRKNQDLAQTIVKLNGIIKTGQDALAQEQKLVETLKQELSGKNSPESNNRSQEIDQISGVASTDVGTSV